MLSFFSLIGKEPRPIKRIFWIKKLPLEILLEVMSYLSCENLESLITVLGMDLTGVVQYVEDNPSIFPRSFRLQTVNLKDLDHKRNKSLMNIVIIKNPGMLDMKKMARRLGGSINAFVISNVKVDMTVQFNFLPNVLEQLLYPKFCKRSGSFQVSDSDLLRVRFRDVSQVSFKNINELILVQCKVGEGSRQLTMSDVKVLRLLGCSRKIIQYHAKEYQNRDVMPIADLVLSDLYINCEQLIISGSDFGNSIFKGTVLTLFSDSADQRPLRITKVRAPQLSNLKIEFYNSPSVLVDFYAPNLKTIQILKWRMNWYPQTAFNDDTQADNESNEFLCRVEVLELRFYWEPLYKVQLKYLSTLTLYMHTNLGPMKNDFPRLETLHIFLMEDANLVPRIKAKNLIRLVVTSSRNLRGLGHDQAQKWYPRLRYFSYNWSPRFNFL